MKALLTPPAPLPPPSSSTDTATVTAAGSSRAGSEDVEGVPKEAPSKPTAPRKRVFITNDLKALINRLVQQSTLLTKLAQEDKLDSEQKLEKYYKANLLKQVMLTKHTVVLQLQ